MQNAFSLLQKAVSNLIREFTTNKNETAEYIDADRLETLYCIKKSQAAKMRMNNELPFFCGFTLRYVYRLTDNEIANGHKNRAKIVEAWQYMHDRYRESKPKRAEEILKHKFEELESWAIRNGVLEKFVEIGKNLCPKGHNNSF